MFLSELKVVGLHRVGFARTPIDVRRGLLSIVAAAGLKEAGQTDALATLPGRLMFHGTSCAAASQVGRRLRQQLFANMLILKKTVCSVEIYRMHCEKL